MHSYKILDHTGDIRLSLTGDSFSELFTAGLNAIADILKRGACGKHLTIPDTVTISAPDMTALLIDFLSEIILLSATKRAIYCNATFFDLTKTHLTAFLQGTPVAAFDEDIKAVTYHEANIIKNKRGWYETTIVLDM